MPPPPPKRRAILSALQIRQAIPKLQRRIADIDAIEIERWTEDVRNELDSLHTKIEGTLIDILGHDTLDYERHEVDAFWRSVPLIMGARIPDHEISEYYQRAIERAYQTLLTLVDELNEKLEDMGEAPGAPALRAFEGLELHPEIDRRAAQLYRDGHYANAVEAAVKALNGLVRLRSGLEMDGSQLMDKVFSPKNPVLTFNDLKSQNDKDEQRGFMMLFSGAVVGLRNPRAHRFIEDDPERALEFIAFVSLLAKLLDKANLQVNS